MNELKEALTGFLADPELSVGVIKGEWGVGKTYFWNNFIEGIEIPESKGVFYVSLFGVSNVGDLRKKLLTGLVPRGVNVAIGNKKAIFSKLSKLTNFAKPLKGFNVKGISLGNVESLAMPFLEKAILTNSIICFDDLERTDGLKMKEFLGVVAELSEQRSCKVVLIYNEQALESEEEKIMAAYREKVVDIEWKFEPAIKDNIKKIWEGDISNEVIEGFESVGKNNLRVMKKVRSVIGYFDERAGSDEAVKKLVVERVVLMCASYYCFPLYRDFLRNRKNHNYVVDLMLSRNDDSKKNKDPIENKLIEILGWSQTELDSMIIAYLEAGYLDGEIVRGFFDSKGGEYKRIRLGEEHSKIWRRLHGGFGNTMEQFVTELSAFIQNNRTEIRIKDIDEAELFLEKLGTSIPDIEDIRNRAIDRFVESSPEGERALYNLDMYGLSPRIIDRIKDRLIERPVKISLDELFSSMVEPDSFSPSKCRYFQMIGDEELRYWLENGSSASISNIKLFFDRFASNDDGGREFCERMRGMIEGYKERSLFDNFKIKRIFQDNDT